MPLHAQCHLLLFLFESPDSGSCSSSERHDTSTFAVTSLFPKCLNNLRPFSSANIFIRLLSKTRSKMFAACLISCEIVKTNDHFKQTCKNPNASAEINWNNLLHFYMGLSLPLLHEALRPRFSSDQ